MIEERKKAGLWPWIVTLLIGLPVLYVASFGPACWILSRRDGPKTKWLPDLYMPIGQCAIRYDLVYSLVDHFAVIGMPVGGRIAVPYDAKRGVVFLQ